MLLVFLLSVLLMAACIASLVIYARVGCNRVVAEVETRLRDAQHIVETGNIPPAWAESRKPGEKNDSVLRRFDSLIAFFQASQSVADEEARELLLSRLRDASRQWAERHAHEVEHTS